MKKSVISLLLLLFFGLSALFLTYALFESAVGGNVQAPIAGFGVRINDVDINHNNYRFDIAEINYEDVNNVIPGKLAPDTTGYFDITFDTRNVDVAFTYQIELNHNLVLGGQIYIESARNITTDTSLITRDNTYLGLFNLTQVRNDAVHTVRIYIRWDVGGDGYVDANTLEDDSFDISINITLEQYLGGPL
jgi:hypothetical protein